jgi:predicted membrane metal-binding protein
LTFKGDLLSKRRFDFSSLFFTFLHFSSLFFTFLHSTCKQFKAQIKKATQNNQIKNGNTTVIVLPKRYSAKIRTEQPKFISKLKAKKNSKKPKDD